MMMKTFSPVANGTAAAAARNGDGGIPPYGQLTGRLHYEMQPAAAGLSVGYSSDSCTSSEQEEEEEVDHIT